MYQPLKADFSKFMIIFLFLVQFSFALIYLINCQYFAPGESLSQPTPMKCNIIVKLSKNTFNNIGEKLIIHFMYLHVVF